MALATAALVTTAACKGEAQAPAAQRVDVHGVTGAPPGHPQGGPPAATSQARGSAGTVIETMDSGGYTYVHVDVGGTTLWAAAPQFEVKVGDAVIVPNGMPMPNYHSKTLDRTFELVYFVPQVVVTGAPAGTQPSMPGAQPASAGQPPTDKIPGHEGLTGGDGDGAGAPIDLTGIERAEGGRTVAECFRDKGNLAGEKIVLRGKVVKFTPKIMGKNWVHVQDGTGAEGSNDLTVTTDAVVNVGDTVVVRGAVATDKDFGFGYKYEVLIEDAEVTVE
jgi:hypothetical protein